MLDSTHLSPSSDNPPPVTMQVHMRVEEQLPRPGVQHHGDAQLRLQAAAPQLQQRLARPLEQGAEEGLGLVAHQAPQLPRQREHHVEVRHRQHPLRARTNPLLLRQRLALGAVPVPAGVVRRVLMSTAGPLVDMPAQGRRAAALDGAQHALLGHAQLHLRFQRSPVLTHHLGNVVAGPPGASRGHPVLSLSAPAAPVARAAPPAPSATAPADSSSSG